MSRSRILGGLAVACMTLAAGAVMAQTASPAPVAAPAARAERAAAPVTRADFVERRLAPLSAMDADRDGTITTAERQAARETRVQAALQRRFDRLDANRDGAVSREEFQTASTGRGERVRAARAGRDGRHHARRATMARHRGGDMRGGHMRGGEARAAQPVVVADVRARAEAAFDRLDADKDGVLTQAERQSARAALRERRVERRGGREGMRQMRRYSAPAASPSAPASE